MDQDQDSIDLFGGFQAVWHNSDIAWEPSLPSQSLLNQTCICLVCGTQVSVLRPGGGSLWCCGQPMEMLPLVSQ